MRAYPVPLQLEEEERIIGGYLTLRQLVYLVLGAVLGGGTAAGAFFLPLVLRSAVFILFAGAGAALALIPVQETRLDVFLFRWLKWRLGQREFFWRGD
ncbi:MAG: PrgI family protein [Moorella sp. (in: Bacteria)]|nr:PrgI family protein [Moorella sp. (in: firmicutes)]